MGGEVFPGVLFPEWTARGSFTSGSVTLDIGKSNKYSRINVLDLTQGSLAAGVKLVLRNGGTLMHVWPADARFLEKYGPGVLHPGYGAEALGGGWTLSLPSGSARVSYTCIGNYNENALV